MRIGGLASGMDIDKMVNDLMKAERMPLQNMEQDRTWLTWQRDAYRDVNKNFMEFRSQLTDMKMSTAFRERTTSSTNSDLVTASASSAASQSSYNISEVSQLASAATKVNASSIFDDPESVDTRKSLKEMEAAFSNPITWKQGSVKSESISVKSDNNEFSLNLQAGTTLTNLEDMSIQVGNDYYTAVTGKPAEELADHEVNVDTDTGDLTFKNDLGKGSKIDAKYVTDFQVDTMTTAAEGTTIKLSNQQVSADGLTLTIGESEYTAAGTDIVDSGNNVVGSIDSQEGIITMDDGHIEADSDVQVKYNYDYMNFGVGSHTEEGFKNEMFNIKGSQSFDSMVNEVNGADNGVSMFYDDMTGQMSLTRTETGHFNEGGDGDEIITSGSFTTDQLHFTDNTQENGGQNAKFTLNGLTTERTSNSFEVSGVTFNLKHEFSGENVRVNIANDTDAVFENIKGFVEKYNELIGNVQDKLQEERHRDYRPLTEKQREDMSEHQQELWEEKSKSGMLRRDPMLSGALNDMRRDFYTQVENSGIPSGYDQLASIGINTTPNYLEGGKLEINEAELKSAIQNNPEAVEELFTSQGSSYNENGILQRMTDSVNQAMDQITEKAGNSFTTESQYTMGERLDDMNDRITAFEDRLVQVEDRYWRQFTQMEKAIQQMNSQSNYLMQQFGG
ncbi:flagellar filament capping protein FliD [Lentibacillus salicampi]|uniref:Flagellar hook-associated protein 2 n=1 Tax=Lentibacillus salicampi TaxID=175306 RepID=A0A4Y9AFZ8_9BACI|nr:flagellar filament capping protein FliD [Lentibacillus salicampi]TFJ94292.1 flagellar hook protein [Lentibacillus salicampi]